MLAVGVLFSPQSAEACGRWRACRHSRNHCSQRCCQKVECYACEAVASAGTEASDSQVIQLQTQLRLLQQKVDSLETTVKQVPALIEKVNTLEATVNSRQ
jgi:hypothetical protein